MGRIMCNKDGMNQNNAVWEKNDKDDSVFFDRFDCILEDWWKNHRGATELYLTI